MKEPTPSLSLEGSKYEKSTQAEYRQKLKWLAQEARIARDIYIQAMRELAIDILHKSRGNS